MSDFEVGAELSIVVPQRELRSAREEVEDALADIPVGMSASGGGAGGGTNAAREQRRRRREFRWARQRTDDTEAQLEVLENIEGELTEGGFGGGGDIISSVTDLGGEAAGIASDVGTTLVEAIPSALGSLVGTAVGQQVGDGGDSGGGGGDLQIQEPLGVTVENTPLAVADEGDGPRVEVDLPALNPRFEPVFQPTFEPDFAPDFSPTFRPTFEPVFDPEFTTELSPEFDLPDLSVGGGGSRLSEPVSVIVENTPLPVAGRRGGQRVPTGGGDGGSGTQPDFGERFRRGLRDVPIVGDPLADFSETQTRRIERVTPGVSPGPSDGDGGAPGGVSASTGDVNVTVNADVQSAVQQAIESVRREQERQRQELRRDLENQISDLRRQISSNGRSGLGGSVR